MYGKLLIEKFLIISQTWFYLKLISVSVIIFGVLPLLDPFVIPADQENFASSFRFLTLALGIGYLITGFGLWYHRNWARVWMITLFCISAFVDSFYAVMFSPESIVVPVVLSIAIVYLSRQKIRDGFVEPKSETKNSSLLIKITAISSVVVATILLIYFAIIISYVLLIPHGHNQVNNTFLAYFSIIIGIIILRGAFLLFKNHRIIGQSHLLIGSILLLFIQELIAIPIILMIILSLRKTKNLKIAGILLVSVFLFGQMALQEVKAYKPEQTGEDNLDAIQGQLFDCNELHKEYGEDNRRLTPTHQAISLTGLDVIKNTGSKKYYELTLLPVREAIAVGDCEEDYDIRFMRHFYGPDGSGLAYEGFIKNIEEFKKFLRMTPDGNAALIILEKINGGPAYNTVKKIFFMDARPDLNNNRYYNAYEWAYDKGPSNYQNWKGAIKQYSYNKESQLAAYKRLGHVQHLIQDQAQPDHANNVAHASSGFSNKYFRTDSAIIFIIKEDSSRYKPILERGVIPYRKGFELYINDKYPFWDTPKKPDKYLNLRSYFDNMAQESRKASKGFLQPIGSTKGSSLMEVPNIDPRDPASYGQFDNLAKPLIERAAMLNAGNIELFYDIVNNPPYVYRVIIEQEAGIKYRALWKDVLKKENSDDASRVVERYFVNNPDEELEHGNAAKITIEFGSENALVKKRIDEKSALVSVGDHGVPVKSKNKFTLEGNFVPKVKGCKTESKRIVIDVKDEDPHFKESGKRSVHPGNELDRNPMTIPVADYEAPYDWLFYEPGQDRIHSVKVKPPFTIESPNPKKRSIAAGETANYLITVKGGGGDVDVTLSVAGLPEGSSSNYPTTIHIPKNSKQKSNLIIKTDSQTTSKNYPLVISAKAKGITCDGSVNLEISSSRTTIQIEKKADLKWTNVKAEPAKIKFGGSIEFSGTVTNVGRAPSGPSALRIESPGSSQDLPGKVLRPLESQDISIVASGFRLPPGTYLVTFSADALKKVQESNESNNIVTITFVVEGSGEPVGGSQTGSSSGPKGSGDYNISVNPAFISVEVGGQVSGITVSVQGINNYNSLVSLTPTPNQGIIVNFDKNAGTPPFSSSVTISVEQSVQPGLYLVGIHGKGQDGITHLGTLTLDVKGPQHVPPQEQ